MNQLRFSNLHNTSSAYGQAFLSGLEMDTNPTNPTANQGIDEYVIGGNGTIASFQDSVSLSNVLNDNNRAYSFVIR